MTSTTQRPIARRLVIAALVVVGIGVPLLPLAQSTLNATLTATPRFVPMGVAAAGNFSTAWFHEAASNRAMACSTNPATGGAIACVSVTLP